MFNRGKGKKSEFVQDNRRFYMANMSHEIRTPMNAIMGIANMLLGQVKDPEEREYLSDMQTATRNLLMTINSILDYESMLDGNISINSAPFEISELINDVTSIARINIGEKNVHFLVDADPGLPSILKGDATRIKQVLVHLLSNADKFTREGVIKLSVSGKSDEDTCKVTFQVSDTGKGMSEDIIKRIFLPYEQENSSASRDEGGLGIGLTIGKALVERMDGRINVESEEGVGTTFSFTLSLPIICASEACTINAPEDKYVALFIPDKEDQTVVARLLKKLGVPFVILSNIGEIFVESGKKKFTHLFLEHSKFMQVKDVSELRDLGITFVDFVDSTKEVVYDRNTVYAKKPIWYKNVADVFNGEGITGETGKVETKETITITGARALIVDDNDINLKVSQGLLKPYGLAIDTAGSAAEGIRLINKTKYDIIFMDHMMPGMDGVEATKAIRGYDDAYHRSVPIIALSANTIEGVEALFKSAGMNDFLPKPVETALLEACLKKWLPPEKVTVTTVEFTQGLGTSDRKFGGFKYIDVTTGLGYTNGNAEMYTSLIKDFSATIQEKKDTINKLSEGDDIGRFTIEVHALKSTSKMLGALSLSEKALELERLGHKRNLEAIHDKIPSLNEEIDKVIMDLQPFGKKEDAPVKKRPVDRDALRQSLRSLYYAADDFDYDGAKEIISGLGIYNFDDSLEKVYDKMQTTIEDIDYEGTRLAAAEMLAML